MGGAPPSPLESSLRKLLTPELFSHLVTNRLPYPPQSPINFSHFANTIFLTDPYSPLVSPRAWPALLALSQHPLSSIPDLATFLPPPSSPSYPTQTLGLLLLLDHIPRLLFRGIDQRYTYSFFSHLSQSLALSWHSLPSHLRPDSYARWKHEQNVALDYWIAVRFWFATPFVHSEKPELQEIAITLTEETRATVEKETGSADPYRQERDEILGDSYAFPRVYNAGPPRGDQVTRESFTWWMGMLFDVHKPIIDRFGRYPYLNGITGRDANDGEEKWLEEINHFAEADEESVRRVREDVKAGRWSPLGTDTPR
uniref:Uncharacterized protein n=2 Tax=Podospora anserina (strain S / ATCC MYA-4624 / DSM 980 / FGSC 10383) TaxID=515849 RepID=A0A090CS74_PODAN|nr:Putative protein of unknown function [Podospora anserina S mat+]